MAAKLPPGLQSAPLISDWLTPIGGGRLRVCTGRAELGQGALTALKQMAAEELDVPPDSLEITGPDTGASPDEGFTAGSLSISQGGAAIRSATSALRALVLGEAARRLNAGLSLLAVKQGRIIDGETATDLTLAGLAGEIDLGVPVSDHAGPKPAGARHLNALDRIDLRDRMVGAPFVHDMAPEGLLFGRVFHPPTLDSRLADDTDLDTLASRPGVVTVVRDGGFLGIVAETEAQAAAAARWFEARLSWATPDGPSDPFHELEASDAEVEEIDSAGMLPEAEATADFTVRRPFLSHGAMGPSTALAQWTEEGLTVWSHTQGVYPLRKAIAEVFGEPEERVRVIHANGAGCYGHNGADDAALEAALLARACPGRPVRLSWNRASEFRAAPVGAAMMTRVRIWMDETGRLDGMHVNVTSPPHATRPSTNGAPCLRSGHLLDKPFPFPVPGDLPAARGGGAARNGVPLYGTGAHLTERKLVTGLPWRTSSLRALGAYLNVYGIETALEAAIIERGLDPFEVRLANLEDKRSREVLERLRAMSSDIIGEETEERNWGIAFARYKNTAAWAAVLVEAELGDELRATRVRIACDMGEVVNPDGALNQLEGGAIQSLSWTLKEALTLDGPAIGTAGWGDYPILRFSEIPEVRVEMIDRPEEPPLGCAEAVQGPVAAALGNAVQRMIGVPVLSLPLTRESVIAAVSA
ncbi:molybdopterin cofactor-binding domain-containing protein [Histidinibacterium aquaticum]|uniref:Molybdopterin-dependent oxidoreductase n=1 Tax=Histidinibacterium aquaticum TaxID=2613962 RepID=A0A5J5GG75_9RHOB|nr:molybdopterin cofactor-binding domain-containing protein [Histidinibacterium aquaticum]KAA9006778.1 molybdopterin-dependent oxidoreductase [Histidinibacterium aquaticum]